MTRLATMNRPDPNPLAPYLADIRQTGPLTLEEERDLSLRIAAGDDKARERMVMCHLRLVLKIAHQYLRRGLPLSDLIGEGNLGLLRAVDHFDPHRGIRFSTYATYWIKQSVEHSLLNAGRLIRLPTYIISLMTKWRKAEQELRNTLGREPVEEELAEALKIRPGRVDRLKEALAACRKTIGSHSDSTLLLDQHMADIRNHEPESEVAEWEARDQVRHMLDDLDDREAVVIRLRFGLEDDEPCSLQEIGDRLGLTRERIRQIESAALRRLSNRLKKVETTTLKGWHGELRRQFTDRWGRKPSRT